MAYNLEKAAAKGNPRAIAKINGHDKYMPNRPCPKGHQSLRYAKYGQCLDCLKISKEKYRATEKGKAKDKEYSKNYERKGKQNARLNLYGITQEEYDALILKQNSKCAICKIGLDMGKRTCIDHCHNSKKVRGILCWSCNVGLGHFKDNPELLNQAALYCAEI
jgi:hypothetical protein